MDHHIPIGIKYSTKGEEYGEIFLKSCSFFKKNTNIYVPFYKTILESFWYNEINEPGIGTTLVFIEAGWKTPK